MRCLKLQRGLAGNEEEAEVKTEDVLNVFHRACDVVEGKAGQQQLAAPTSTHPEVDVAVRIHQLRDVLASVDVELEAGDDGNPMEPNAHRWRKSWIVSSSSAPRRR